MELEGLDGGAGGMYRPADLLRLRRTLTSDKGRILLGEPNAYDALLQVYIIPLSLSSSLLIA